MTIKPECMPLIIVNTKNEVALFRPSKATLRKKKQERQSAQWQAKKTGICNFVVK